MSPRYLTKSRFKLALECPVKLFYTGKPGFPDIKQDDPFLEALADGGFQVGALAKLYYPVGIEINEKGYDAPVEKTDELLKKENVIIFEAAFRFRNLFIRADIVEKTGNTLRLIEVKSKSFDGVDFTNFLINSGFIESDWIDYLYDVAFQQYVISKAYPDLKVVPYIMLADKNKKATVDGLNQKFLLNKGNEERTVVQVIGLTSFESIGEKILIEVNIEELVRKIFSGTDRPESAIRAMDFKTMIHFYADNYELDKKISNPIGTYCKDCQYKCSDEDERSGFKSGFKSCWKETLHWSDRQFKESLIFEIWNYRGKQRLLDNGIYFLKDVTQSHIGDLKPSADGSLTLKERQWLQIERTKNHVSEPFFKKAELASEMLSWKYPLHFIDFETAMAAIPFNKGRRPYEGIAFQFSHHIVDQNGNIEHKGEYLNFEPGVFPNFNFIKELKKELGNDDGTIFRYAAHENTFLNHIYRQLNEVSESEVSEKEQLKEFIRSISHSVKDSVEKWRGPRDMIDLCKMVKKYFYHIDMKGSNSIKVVLPTVLKLSDFIGEKYSKPVYGAVDGIVSHNFHDYVWYRIDDEGNVMNPYKLLPPLFNDLDQEVIENLITDENIADGGAAMTAYARMQFTQMSEIERQKVKEGLLRYCELDTLAMVMIWEYWNEIIKS